MSSTSNVLPIIPFGKYKGKSITELMQDTEYLQWCKQQEWFKKYPIIYNICVNQTITTNTNTNQKTPEHNKLQNLFLEKENQNKFLIRLFKLEKDTNALNEIYKTKEYKEYFGDQKFEDCNFNCTVIFEGEFNWDICMACKYTNSKININPHMYEDIQKNDKNITELIQDYRITKSEEIKKLERYSINLQNKYGNTINNIFKNIRNIRNISDNRYYYDKSIDTSILFPNFGYYSYIKIYIEVKPLVGDDYPTILRKMTTQIKLTETPDKHGDRGGLYVLLIDKFESSSTTKDQLLTIFNNSNISVIFMNDWYNKSSSAQLLITPQEETKENTKSEEITIESLTKENKILTKKLAKAKQKIEQLEKQLSEINK